MARVEIMEFILVKKINILFLFEINNYHFVTQSCLGRSFVFGFVVAGMVWLDLGACPGKDMGSVVSEVALGATVAVARVIVAWHLTLPDVEAEALMPSFFDWVLVPGVETEEALKMSIYLSAMETSLSLSLLSSESDGSLLTFYCRVSHF